MFRVGCHASLKICIQRTLPCLGSAWVPAISVVELALLAFRRQRFVLLVFSRNERTIAVNVEHAEGLLEVGDLILTESVLGHDIGLLI